MRLWWLGFRQCFSNESNFCACGGFVAMSLQHPNVGWSDAIVVRSGGARVATSCTRKLYSADAGEHSSGSLRQALPPLDLLTCAMRFSTW
jgi:hypothetical protein